MTASRARETRPTLLLVNDDEREAAGIAGALEAAGYLVSRASSSIDGLKAIERARPSLVILDWAMPFIDGKTFAQALYAGMDDPPPMIVLADAPADWADVRRMGVNAILSEAITPAQILRATGILLADPKVRLLDEPTLEKSESCAKD